MIHKTCVFFPIAQNFLLVGPYFQCIIFQPQWPLPIALIVWGCGLPNFFWGGIENMPPHFLTHVYYGQAAWWIRIPPGTEVGLGLGDTALDGDRTSPTLKGHSPFPQFSANVHCGQTAGWIKMPLGMEVNLGPGDVVLDGVTAPP